MAASLRQIAWSRRLDVLDMIYQSKVGHIGGDMSCMDILVCLYYQVMNVQSILLGKEDRDRFILSKGHNAEALYAVLADRGFFDQEKLKTYACFDTDLAQHPTRKVPGVEVATGSLGHGLALGVGMALGFQRSKNPAHVYVLMGDGEQAEGSVWEAAMAANKYGLDGLTAIVDRNGLQISGSTEHVMPLEKLEAKYAAFGWRVEVCDGHDSVQIEKALLRRMDGKPLVVIANTRKGYGSPIMQDNPAWHHQTPTRELYEQIRKDLASHMI